MSFMKKFFNQTRKPEGFLGKLMLSSMNTGHAKMADWGLSQLPKREVFQVVELGCGAGRNAGELLKRFPEAHVTAVDYSELSVAKTAAYNEAAIRAGRCTALQGDVSDLQLPRGAFGLATAFETIYFWPGLEKCFTEVARVLSPGRTFLICNESDGTDPTAKKYEEIIDGKRCYTAEEIETALRAAGFSEVKSDHHPSKPWLTVLARK